MSQSPRHRARGRGWGRGFPGSARTTSLFRRKREGRASWHGPPLVAGFPRQAQPGVALGVASAAAPREQLRGRAPGQPCWCSRPVARPPVPRPRSRCHRCPAGRARDRRNNWRTALPTFGASMLFASFTASTTRPSSGKAPVSTVRSARNLSNTSGVASAPVWVVEQRHQLVALPRSRAGAARRSAGAVHPCPICGGPPDHPGADHDRPSAGRPDHRDRWPTVAKRRARTTRPARSTIAKRRARATRAHGRRTADAARPAHDRQTADASPATPGSAAATLRGLPARRHGPADGSARRRPEVRHGHGPAAALTTTTAPTTGAATTGAATAATRADRHVAAPTVVVVHAATVRCAGVCHHPHRSCRSPSPRPPPADRRPGAPWLGRFQAAGGPQTSPAALP